MSKRFKIRKKYFLFGRPIVIDSKKNTIIGENISYTKIKKKGKYFEAINNNGFNRYEKDIYDEEGNLILRTVGNIDEEDIYEVINSKSTSLFLEKGSSCYKESFKTIKFINDELIIEKINTTNNKKKYDWHANLNGNWRLKYNKKDVDKVYCDFMNVLDGNMVETIKDLSSDELDLLGIMVKNFNEYSYIEKVDFLSDYESIDEKIINFKKLNSIYILLKDDQYVDKDNNEAKETYNILYNHLDEVKKREEEKDMLNEAEPLFEMIDEFIYENKDYFMGTKKNNIGKLKEEIKSVILQSMDNINIDFQYQ